MAKKTAAIPVNEFEDELTDGISIEKMLIGDLPAADIRVEAHRHDRHSFFMVENGTVLLEIDFEVVEIKAPSVIYMHPDQVHRTTTSKDLSLTSWAMTNENIHPQYLKLLEDIAPARPLQLAAETFALFTEALSLCLKFAERKQDKLYHDLLKDSCNAVVALVISQYLTSAQPADKFSRFELVTKSFKKLLERDFRKHKRPADYAQKLHLSTPYLNECVKNATGHPVSYHIQQRVILEAKRLLLNADSSVKEIAAALGYDDYPYFSRLFTKAAGMPALSFRNKNLG